MKHYGKRVAAEKKIFEFFEGNKLYVSEGKPSLKQIQEYVKVGYPQLSTEGKYAYVRKSYIVALIKKRFIDFNIIWELFINISHASAGPVKELCLTQMVINWREQLWFKIRADKGYEKVSVEGIYFMFHYVEAVRQGILLETLPSPYIEMLIPNVLRQKHLDWKEYLMEALSKRGDVFSAPEEWLNEYCPYDPKVHVLNQPFS